MKIFWIIVVAFLSMFKFLATPPIAYLAMLSFWETVISVNLGGVGGFVLFYFLVDFYLQKKDNGNSIIKTLFSVNDSTKKIKRARKILNFKKKLSPIPFMFFSPILSVPVAAYLARKFFRRSSWAFLGFVIAMLVWGFGACLLFSPIIQE